MRKKIKLRLKRVEKKLNMLVILVACIELRVFTDIFCRIYLCGIDVYMSLPYQLE